MEDPRWEPGMPALDRQAGARSLLPTTPRGVPRSVPETSPTPLQRHYVMLSVVVLICGAVAITALEFGMAPSSMLVKLCALIGAPLLTVTTLDAAVRIWRSALAWLPVNRGRGLFRVAWVVAAVVGLVALVAGAIAVILA